MRPQPPRHWSQVATLAILALALGYLAWLGWGLLPGVNPQRRGFDGDRALRLAKMLCDIGPRPAGSAADWSGGDAIRQELERLGWKTSAAEYMVDSKQLRNIVGMAGQSGPLLVLATHYDTRSLADADPDPARRQQPSPGANNGASGAAVLLELARALDASRLQHRVWLLFLDGEADAGLPDWPASSGARNFLAGRHGAAVIYLDKVGAPGAIFPPAPDANDLLQTQLWRLAQRLGGEERFPMQPGPGLEPTPALFAAAGLPTVAISQPHPPFNRTSQDTCDRLDAYALKAVGVLLESYLENNAFLTIVPSLGQ